MRPAPWAVPTLLLLLGLGCSPVASRQEAARQLRFKLEGVEPSLELAYPLERSRVRLRLRVAVENPSSQRFNLRSFRGSILLERSGAVLPLGAVTSETGLDLAAGGRGILEAEVAFGYGDVREHWGQLQGALAGDGGVWLLRGEMRTEALGIPFSVPVQTRLSAGGPP